LSSLHYERSPFIIAMKLRAFFLSLWGLWDPFYYYCSHLTLLDPNNRKNNVFRVKLVRYKGHPITLKDGTMVRKNDLLVKIHLHNVRLLKDMVNINSEFRKGLFIYKKIKDALPTLAQYVHKHDRTDEIKGIIGISMLHQGSERLGFEIHGIYSRFYRWFKTLAQYPIHLLASDHPYHARHRVHPKYLFMSKATLISRYYIHLDQRAISNTMDGL